MAPCSGRTLAVTCVAFITVGSVSASAQPGHFKVAAYNIQSGTGQPGLAGRIATFVESSNCTDLSQPLNAWGVGFVQRMLTREVGADSSVIALALSEAWQTVCGSPEHVRAVLGWRARTQGHNGTALLARYGFAGPEEWIQLDTSLNTNPADTMWVVRAPVCIDSGCTSSIAVFATHWYGAGPDPVRSYSRQAEQTLEFMHRFGDSYQVLAGDLNVWEDSAPEVCDQSPAPYGLTELRNAGYIDAWPAAHGGAEGYTGMVNRTGCGNPEGYAWKRIDYVWSLGLMPASAVRFGIVTAGDEAPSDHYGLIAEYGEAGDTPPSAVITSPLPGSTVSGIVSVSVTASDDGAVASVELLVDGTVAASATAAPWTLRWDTTLVSDGQHTLAARARDDRGQTGTGASVSVTVANLPAQPVASEIVLYARNASTIAGAWRRTSDLTAAAGEAVAQPDLGAAKISTALAAPTDYFELTFDAVSSTPYRLWLRMQADRNYYGNDSVHVQFSDSVDQAGQPVYRIGTSASTVVVLEDCSGCGLSGWGWQDNGYGTNVLGPVIYFGSTGPHTIRIQAREDGVRIDQVVLSPIRYLSMAPGAVRNDSTILQSTQGVTLPPVPTEIVLAATSATTIAGAWRRVADATAAGGAAVAQPDAGAAKIATALASPSHYFELGFDAVAGQPYRLWLRMKAERNYYGNDSVHVQFTGAVDPAGRPVYQVGTTASTVVVLEDCSGCVISGWGWQDNGYGLNVLGPVIYFDSTGKHTIRVQAREDGVSIDQIVISPKQYLAAAPGAVRDDSTILAH